MEKYYLSIGEVDAPVVVESYINIGCPDTVNYFEAAYTTFDDLINEGKVKHVIKHIDRTNGLLLKGSVVNAHLDYNQPEKTYKILRDLFSTQSVWSTSYELMLDKLNRQLYLKEEQGSGKRSKLVIEEANAREIKEIPTVFINGEQLSFDFDDSIENISALLRQEVKQVLEL